MESFRKEYQWDNSSNLNYYNKLSGSEFDTASELSGLAPCCDMVVIQTYIEGASRILEVGAGRGRATKYLCNNARDTEIVAVEYSQTLYNHLISLALPAKIHHTDIMSFKPKTKFDLIILPWSCFTEFNPSEELSLLRHLNNMCLPEATICIDLMSTNAAPSNVHSSSTGQFHYIQCDAHQLILSTYLPTDEEMASMAEKSGFTKYHNINYVTATNRARRMHIMQKKTSRQAWK